MSTLQIGSHTLYYEECGQGQPLVLISGLGATRLSWWKQLDEFARHFRLILLDNRDAGDSAHCPDGYGIADMADDTAALIRHLGIAPAYVMGWSMGGFIAQELALRHPDALSKLVLVATSAGGATHVQPTPEVVALLMRNNDEDIAARVRRGTDVIAHAGYVDANPQDLQRLIQNAHYKPMPLDAYQRQLMACIAHDTSKRVAQIGVPTLVIHGDYDPLVPYPNGQYLAQQIPRARFSTYEGVGHLPPLEASDRFAADVLAFLKA